MRISLLSGGESAERSISIKSGQAVEHAIKQLGHDLMIVDGTLANIELLSPQNVDCVFSVLHGGSGENGDVQRILEDKGIPFVGTGSETSALCADKHRTKLLFTECDVPTPLAIYVTSKSDLSKVRDDMFPCVVKPAFEGSSFGLSYVSAKDTLEAAYDQAAVYGAEVLIETYIEGRELTVGVLAGEILPCVEIVTSHQMFDYQAKYEKGLTEYLCPLALDVETQQWIDTSVQNIQSHLDLKDFYRFDLILSDEIPYFLEINTIPGFTETSLLPMAAKELGISFEQVCDKIIQSAMERF